MAAPRAEAADGDKSATSRHIADDIAVVSEPEPLILTIGGMALKEPFRGSGMAGNLIHDFEPAIGQILGLSVYWYGAVYSVGFVGILLWFGFRRRHLGFSRADVLDLTIAVAAGVLVGGRAFDIAVYELDYYRLHPWQILDWWRGGMASHGVLIGGLTAAALFCRAKGKPLLAILDELAVPAAFLLAVGRLGNFIEGGVVGTVTAMPWGFDYPDLDGPRHPVALYECAKNLVIVPILVLVLRRWPAGSGMAAATFVLLYGGLRFGVDVFRDYEAHFLGIGTGQVPNLVMAAAGLALLVRFQRRPGPVLQVRAASARGPGWLRVAILLFLLFYPLGIPTSWTTANIEEQRRAAMQTPPVDSPEPATGVDVGN